MKGSSLQSVALNANQRTPNNMQILHKNKAIKRKLSSSYDKENVNPSAITQNKNIHEPTVANVQFVFGNQMFGNQALTTENDHESSNRRASSLQCAPHMQRTIRLIEEPRKEPSTQQQPEEPPRQQRRTRSQIQINESTI